MIITQQLHWNSKHSTPSFIWTPGVKRTISLFRYVNCSYEWRSHSWLFKTINEELWSGKQNNSIQKDYALWLSGNFFKLRLFENFHWTCVLCWLQILLLPQDMVCQTVIPLPSETKHHLWGYPPPSTIEAKYSVPLLAIHIFCPSLF